MCCTTAAGLSIFAGRGGPVLTDFWARLRRIEPELEVFADLDDGLFAPDTMVPLFIHGDGGRTYKHQELMVLQMQPLLGHGSAKSRQLSANGPGVGLKGHSFTTRFLYGVLEKQIYSENPKAFHRFLTAMAEDLQRLYYAGVWHQRLQVTFRFCIVGCKGDLPFLSLAGNLVRTFRHIRKRKVGRTSKPLTGCCWICFGGSEHIPFEDFRARPLWLETMGSANPAPWDMLPPFLEYMPTNVSDLGSFFKVDVLHTYHLGVGRDFAASSLVYLLGHYEDSVPNSLEKMNSDFKAFLQESKRVVHFRKFTRDLLGYPGDKDYPVGHWSKAMDTSVVVEFVLWLADKFGADDRADQLLRSACRGIATCMRTMLESGLWMGGAEAEAAGRAGFHFVQCYGKLVRYFFDQGMCLYNLVPKLHAWHHICLFLMDGGPRGFALNPLSYSCFQDEDFVGRVSRISRRVSPKLLHLRTIQRYLLATRQELDRMDEHGLQPAKRARTRA